MTMSQHGSLPSDQPPCVKSDHDTKRESQDVCFCRESTGNMPSRIPERVSLFFSLIGHQISRSANKYLGGPLICEI